MHEDNQHSFQLLKLASDHHRVLPRRHFRISPCFKSSSGSGCLIGINTDGGTSLFCLDSPHQITGTIRAISLPRSKNSAPGLVDSPPTSIMAPGQSYAQPEPTHLLQCQNRHHTRKNQGDDSKIPIIPTLPAISCLPILIGWKQKSILWDLQQS